MSLLPHNPGSMCKDHEKLLKQATQGDSSAIESLLLRHLPALQAFIRLKSGRQLRAKESSSDVAQSVCVELLGQLPHFKFKGEAAFKNWLFTAALNKIQSRSRYYSAQKRDVGRELGQPAQSRGASCADFYATLATPSRAAMGQEALERFELAFDSLPEDYREVITSSRIIGLSRKEIAEKMGRSEDSVRGLLQRALTRLSWILSRDENNDPIP